MLTILDVENTITERDGKKYLDPFEPNNKLVQVGVICPEMNERYIVTFNHVEVEGTVIHEWNEAAQTWVVLDSGVGFDLIQDILDSTTLLVGHNIAYDLVWLWECGFSYAQHDEQQEVFDTMLGEYLLQRGQKLPLSLGDVAERRNLKSRKLDTLMEHMDKGQNVDTVPLPKLIDYLAGDLLTTEELYNELVSEYAGDAAGLRKVLDLTNELCVVLAEIYQTGAAVDHDALLQVGDQFTEERDTIKAELEVMAEELMGDTPINLGSPAQLSALIFSREPNDKKTWADNFSNWMKPAEFRSAVTKHSKVVKKTRAKRCTTCKGTGRTWKTKKDGQRYAKPNICKPCEGEGVLFIPTAEVAGLKFSAPEPKWVTANGFGTSKLILEQLAATARGRGLTDAENFLNKLRRLSALDSYLSN
ncbi:MAG TPA: hypothetical protein V6D20_01745, partial [Candidatus Obscuribacterales bacterium]